MTTIFSKEIERLEKGCGRFIDYRADNFNDLFRCSENNLCPTCKAKLQTLKQAEQKHLKFVEELKNNAKCINCGALYKEHKEYSKTKHISCCPECDHRISFFDIDNLKGDEK